MENRALGEKIGQYVQFRKKNSHQCYPAVILTVQVGSVANESSDVGKHRRLFRASALIYAGLCYSCTNRLNFDFCGSMTLLAIGQKCQNIVNGGDI